MANNGLRNKKAWKMSIFKNEQRESNITENEKEHPENSGETVTCGVIEAMESKGTASRKGHSQ